MMYAYRLDISRIIQLRGEEYSYSESAVEARMRKNCTAMTIFKLRDETSSSASSRADWYTLVAVNLVRGDAKDELVVRCTYKISQRLERDSH
jgi:hypothetical protein